MGGHKASKAGKVMDFEELATAALDPLQTGDFFVQYEGLFVDICARWISSGSESNLKIAAFGRIVPLAPYLAEHAERFLAGPSQSILLGQQKTEFESSSSHELELLQGLLGIFRLLSFDCRTFSSYVRPVILKELCLHSSRVIRLLAVRTMCLYVHAADYATQEMISAYVSEGEVLGAWEDKTIDYRFLSLWEEKRWRMLQSKLQAQQSSDNPASAPALTQQLSPFTVNVNGVLLPRLDGASSKDRPSALISTPTTESNLHNIGLGLLQRSPILLTGVAGSGKTLLTRHFAWQLNKLDTMVTLHLNEQSDAKLLVGMYATGAKPGSFSWRPGVLTTAVKEGRWIFIEDLDRAPNEVISTLLPLIERGELLIPSRGETIRAARGFRIIATMRSTLNPRGQEIAPRQNMIGHRFWNHISVQMPELSEFEVVVTAKYPMLRQHASGIMGVYSRLIKLFSDPKFASENGTSLRALTPRDLLKWCDRIAVLLGNSTTFTASKTDDIFMEAYDCFAGSLRDIQARFKVMAYVAEELHIDPQRRDHLLGNREVKLEIPNKSTSNGTIRIGRSRLSKLKSARRPMSSRPFSTNDYTLRLLEKVAVAVDRQEPLLLVGETGTGKTTCIQYLAEQLGRKLVAFNLSQQSESGDLLGGYKPVNVRSLVIPLKDEFDDLFDITFSKKKNLRFMEMMGKRVARGEWKRVCILWREALKRVDAARKTHESQPSSPDPEDGQPKKKRKVDGLPAAFPKARWEKFAADLHNLESQLASGSETFAFSFLEGNIVKAVRNGDWVLLDEINLASSDTLEALADLLGGGPDGTPSILLTETGNIERVVAHPNFRVFAAMNPATDVGKKDLPPGIRSRFTELYVESPDSDVKSLRNIVEKYLGGDSSDPVIVKTAMDVTHLYLDIQRLAKENKLVDGADQKAHFSLRTLTRTLFYARDIAPLCTLRRALYEGFNMSFLTFLGKSSEDLVAPLIRQHLFGQKAGAKAELGKPLQQPSDGRSYVRQGHYWLRQGSHSVEEQPHYIITPFVQRNMNNLIRASSTRRYPVLIQGPTSAGKTSMIEYLAKLSGNKFVRINNHEHTDLQEYLGSYISGTDGKLVFQEGILVRALREGHWIVLDELNLAPTDVLEALNRLLDDNRELLIPETQEVVRPHDDFMLFATQNPAGLYGGRKVLSRAFRNRFLELHFDDIPVEELTEILHRRTMIPESWCKRIVKVYQELSILRQENRLFEQKSFATLRDLFRWAQRKADTIQELAVNGYMLLAERVRKDEERNAVKNIIETVMSKNGPRVMVDEDWMYSSHGSPEIKLCDDKEGSEGVVWTQAMRRLFVLVAHAMRNNEPVLLVGETGCGKTTVCQMLADTFDKQLHIVNAHQNTETGDLIGAQRPIRNRADIEKQLSQQLSTILGNPNVTNLETLLQSYDKLDKATRDAIPVLDRDMIQLNRVKAAALFEWADGSLVHAMKTGQYFLLDEISLADDSVLERLNSVLESSRTLLLAEKGPIDSFVTASEGFQFLATMNPGGDYGKRELSPALRNRFTEIWVPALSDLDDVLQIVQSKLKPNVAQYADAIVSFGQWFNQKFNTSAASSISIRDILAWITFVNNSTNNDPILSVVHGAAMVFIDTLGANPAGLLAISPASIDEERRSCLQKLGDLLDHEIPQRYFDNIEVVSSEDALQLGNFSISKHSVTATEDVSFSLEAPTTRTNAMRVVRALQLAKPILLEGNPGVGKTTLVTALAKAIGKPLTRLNLSEQTDLMDLFGSDIPVEGGQAGTFAWQDAPFLKAMKRGDWVLLDEMNLASQSVLEGLNAVLDHRGEVYISELDQTFHKHENFRVFAAQNPHHQGGGRKGLPASFVNRFTVVYADVFRPDDLYLICAKIFPTIEHAEIRTLINFVATLDEQVVQRRAFGALGHPWEFNLRDTLRWLQLLESKQGSARDFLDAVFIQRFRTEADRAHLLTLFGDVYGKHEARISLYHNVGTRAFQVGLGVLERDPAITRPDHIPQPDLSQLTPMEALMVGVKRQWPIILVGSSGSGKTKLLSQLASLAGADLATFSMNADIDAMDIVGGYEQVDPSRGIHDFLARLDGFVRRKVASRQTSPDALNTLLGLLEVLRRNPRPSAAVVYEHLNHLLKHDYDSELYHELLEDLGKLAQLPTEIEGARFQWVDGILIQSLEQGKWLVLDNANLCSSAVLDRLNSLLEPNGYLSINEHSTADGEARIVRPHKDFRIFLTMDPRFGELSRAMRNRAVELCLLTNEDAKVTLSDSRFPTYATESQMYRFRHFANGNTNTEDTFRLHADHLSASDTALLHSFNTQLTNGLAQVSSARAQEDSNGTLNSTLDASSIPTKLSSQIAFEPFFDFLTKEWAAKSSHLHLMLNSFSQHAEQELYQASSYHPLNNELYVNMSSDSSELSVWSSWLYDSLIDVFDMSKALEMVPSVKFERRLEKKRLPPFLHAYRRTLVNCLDTVWAAHKSGQNLQLPLQSLRGLFWAFLELAMGHNMDRAAFQTYLKMLNEQLSSISGDEDFQGMTLVKKSLEKELLVFGSHVQLRTGLGMERIWKHFKPVVARNTKQLDAIITLETLADRLDAAMWKSDLKIEEMIQIRERFASSLYLVRHQDIDASELVLSLEDFLRGIENSTGDDDNIVTPYFEGEFEGLSQFIDLRQSIPQPIEQDLPDVIQIVRAKVSLLAKRPTKASHSTIDHTPSQYMSNLYHYTGISRPSGQEMALQGHFHVSALQKLHHANEVQLAQLAMFESELQVFAQHVALESDRITYGLADTLHNSLDAHFNELVASHSDVFSLVNDALQVSSGVNISGHMRDALRNPLGSMNAIRKAGPLQDPSALSSSWLNLALAGIALYVPNYPHDPALRPLLERKLFTEKRSALTHKLQALQHFQLGFTGQDTSLRIRNAELEISSMGLEPPVPAIVRPTTSDLDSLQGEFANLLSIVEPLFNGSLSPQEASQDITLRQNISLVIARLVNGYRSYDDITGPAVGFLVCLNIALVLRAQINPQESSVKNSLAYLTQYTPFFGLSDWHTQPTSALLYESCEPELEKRHHSVDIRWHALHSLTIIRNVDPLHVERPTVRGLIHNIFGSLYADWKDKLLKDQEKESKDRSLYTFKGEDQETDDADPELFPDYEGEEEAQEIPSSTTREHAIKVADMHANLLLGGIDSSTALEHMLEWCATQVVRVADGKAHGTHHQNALPTIILALGKRTSALEHSGAGKNYNFYFDANLAEAKRLVNLVHRVQHRYRRIHEALEMDHATVLDVLRTCDEALDFRHVDPVAKFITKVEKLHEFMHAWQPLAKRDLRAPELYDEVTKLLVSWRQLELTTWARLFDIEAEKCSDAAKSWFFIAYETIIAAAEAIHDEKAMRDHAKDLLKTLEGFFSNTTLGQFAQRLKLLQQLREHVILRTEDNSALKPIQSALENFITYFSRLQKPIQESLAKGRQNLEKQVHDVIKLASWKDTTIQALKQSAKTSHRKLSKLVRKFRALLNQPVSGIYKAGFPEQTFSNFGPQMDLVGTEIDSLLLESCVATVPGWNERPTRFKNLTTTISLMRSLSTPGSERLDGATYIESFITDLEGLIMELQKATPTKLTEENKGTIKHLKTRKRKLYADTMKELRQMGIVSNPSSDVLAQQDELSRALSALPVVGKSDHGHGIGSEYFLHKSLSVMSQVREVTREHSGDLTGNDVAKSIGYLEGLLHAVIRQRGQLSRVVNGMHELSKPISKVSHLCSFDREAMVPVSDEQVENFSAMLSSISWLATMLQFGKKILSMQAKLGRTNDLDDIINGLQSWTEHFNSLVDDIRRLPSLPINVWSNAHTELRKAVTEKVVEFRSVFNKWSETHPLSRVVLGQINPYTLCALEGSSFDLSKASHVALDSWSAELFEALDLILGAMQDVGRALQDLPSSTEDATWLVVEERTLSAAISALHTSQITKVLTTIVDKMHSLTGAGTIAVAAGLFTAIQPIIQQYASSHKFLIGKFDALHLSSAKLLYRLAKSFIQVGSQGFCTPFDKSSDQEQGKDDKLESGTGLGAGEGAEDISKDIEDDEDLEDLAQEKGEREGSIEEEEDAVDMGEQEMEGDTGEVADKEEEDGEGEEGDDDVESQVGSVDDLGPSAVDEKMWDEGGKEDDSKEKEGDQDVGTEKQDEQVAADSNEQKEKGEEPEKKEAVDEDEDAEMEGEDQDDEVGADEGEKMDPFAKEEETLDLPEELNLDGNDDGKDENNFDDMDMGDEDEEDMDVDATADPDTKSEDLSAEQEGDEENDTTGHQKDEDVPNEEEGEGEEPIDEDDVVPLPDENAPPDENKELRDDSADANAEAGAGADANDEAHQDQKEQASASAANQEDGKEGETSENKQETNAEDGTLGQTAQPDASGHGEEEQETAETQAFKKLGDVLEKWYNQQRQISESKQKDETQVQQIDKEVDMADADFEHLQDEETEADTQALGTATEEQAKTLDHDMAMAVDEKEENIAARPEDNDEQMPDDSQDVDMEDIARNQEEEPQQQTADGQPQAFIGEQKPASFDQDEDMADAVLAEDDDADISSVLEVETQLELTHLDPAISAMTPENARSLWLQHESSTHSLSQQLTEHLRLILAPTLATKLRGDFRTGKRLNLKRIIPYIASGYKRDKIWLRRSMPSKRSYQVMIALDDSKSMAESGASNLALKTLTLVTRSLSMLEVGEVSVVSFGQDVNVAHDFDKPFTSESGVRVFEQFGFEAGKTDVRRLVDKSLDLFAEARRKGASSVGEDLWQLMLVVSDGICDSHAEIQRLVRRAQEERVMIVFIIIDATATTTVSDPSAPSTMPGQESTANNTKDKTSILDLQSVEISPEGKVIRWKYMERFPFRYYLVVRDVRELPGVLAGALRQWFGEVAGSG